MFLKIVSVLVTLLVLAMFVEGVLGYDLGLRDFMIGLIRFHVRVTP